MIADQFIAVIDLRHFTAVVETGPMTEVEKILTRLRELDEIEVYRLGSC